MRVVSWNIKGAWLRTEWRLLQAPFLASLEPDVLLLQEVTYPSMLETVISELDVASIVCSTGVGRRYEMGTAIVTTGELLARPAQRLTERDFPEVPKWLAQRFAHRSVAADIDTEHGLLRVASLHAPPGASEGVGKLKPWFHHRTAQWMSQWDMPFLFGVDANSPATDAGSADSLRFFITSEDTAGPGEEHLLGPERYHAATDCWHLLHSGRMPEPSCRLNGGALKRFDHILVSVGIEPQRVSHEWDENLSDHAAVVADLDLSNMKPPVLTPRTWEQGDPPDEPRRKRGRSGRSRRLPVLEPRLLTLDDEAWSTHSGGGAHDGPAWRAGDEPDAATLYSNAPPLLRGFLDALMDEPAQQKTADEIAATIGASGRRGVASALVALGRLVPDTRSFPFRWWKGSPSLYAMPAPVAAVFQRARDRLQALEG